MTGSVLNGASTFSSTGATLAHVDNDLRDLIALVPGASRGGVFVMCAKTATNLSLLRGSGGAPGFPSIGPGGGALLQLPVLVTEACADMDSPSTNVVGLLSPAEICWANQGRVTLMTSNAASLQMTSTPSAGALINSDVASERDGDESGA